MELVHSTSELANQTMADVHCLIQIDRAAQTLKYQSDRFSEIIYSVGQLLIQCMKRKLALSNGSNEIVSRPINL